MWYHPSQPGFPYYIYDSTRQRSNQSKYEIKRDLWLGTLNRDQNDSIQEHNERPLLTDRGTDLHRYMSRIQLEPQLQLEHTFLGCK